YVVTPDSVGRLVEWVTSFANTAFPVGESHYDPITLRAQFGSDTIRVAVLDRLPPGLPLGAALDRAWALAHASSATGTLTAAIQWNASEQGPHLDRSLGNPASALAYHWLGNSWLAQPGVRTWDNGLDPAVDTLLVPSPGLWSIASQAGLAVEP